jgi:hypothetical protein
VAYTSTVTRRRDRERDVVRELQEDAKWSLFTNTYARKRYLGRGSLPRSPGLRTYMLAAVVVVGAVVGAIGLIAFVSNLG